MVIAPAVTFPVVREVTVTQFAEATTHLVNMPATVDANDLLVILFTSDGPGDNPATPIDFNELWQQVVPAGSAWFSGYAKKALGTEGGTTVDVVTPTSEGALAHVYRIQEGTWTEDLADLSHSLTTGTSTTADPPDHDPPGIGAADFLWIACIGRNGASAPTAHPANYTDEELQTNHDIAGGSARRLLNAASENPGAFTITNAQWAAVTLAIPPVAAVYAFPKVETTSEGVDDVAGTTTTVTLPAGIVSGDGIVVLFCSGLSTAADIVFPAGYTELVEFFGFSLSFAIAYRQADGTEGATIDVTHNSSKTAFICYRVSGQDFDIQSPENSARTDGNSVSPDPAAVTPGGGVNDYLFLAVYGNDGLVTQDDAPANYTHRLNAAGADADSCGIGSAHRKLNATSEDPAAFAQSAAEGWHAYTIAITNDVVPWPPTDAPAGPPLITLRSAQPWQ